MKAIPDNLRGRAMTTDRAAEISIFSLTSLLAGWSLYAITPQFAASPLSPLRAWAIFDRGILMLRKQILK